MKELHRQTDVVWVDDRGAADSLIQEYREGEEVGGYKVTKNGLVEKEKKVKDEVISSWVVVTIQKDFEFEV